MSTLNVSNITDGTTTVGTSYVVNGSARAWSHLNGSTAVIENSSNISSVTDNGTGNFTYTYSNAMSDADVAVGGMTRNRTIMRYQDATTTSSFRHSTETTGGSDDDDQHTCLVIMGDLA